MRQFIAVVQKGVGCARQEMQPADEIFVSVAHDDPKGERVVVNGYNRDANGDEHVYRHEVGDREPIIVVKMAP